MISHDTSDFLLASVSPWTTISSFSFFDGFSSVGVLFFCLPSQLKEKLLGAFKTLPILLALELLRGKCLLLN